tara:strand:+ start:784 stop:1116 length:333 start_codon:yes stop_codon:yes gene_type:complete
MIDQLGLDAWQLVLLGIAAVVLITMFISEEKKKPKKDTLVAVPVLGSKGKNSIQIVVPHAEPNEDIVRIVCAWSSFRKECVKAGLDEAVEKVDAIFPLLIKLNGGDHVEQ